jgi:subtilisin-like proprotein convertase family protein
VISVITVPTSLTIADIDVSLSITHTWDEDLNIYLIGPLSAPVELSTHNGGSGHGYFGTTFDDEAATSITNGSPPFSGSFRPEGSLSTFDGSNAQGVWSLHVIDDFQIDDGTLISWTLTLRTVSCDFGVTRLYLPVVLKNYP